MSDRYVIGCAGLAGTRCYRRPVFNQASRDEQRGQEQPDEIPSAVGHIDQHDGSDPDACQQGDQGRREAPGQRPRLGTEGPGGRGLGCGPDGGKIGQQIPELTPGSPGQRPSRPLVELSGRQPACLEVLAQVRYDRIAVGIGSPHLSRKIIFRHGVHRASAFLSRAVVRGFGVHLMS
jgi:hypothetical protein